MHFSPRPNRAAEIHWRRWGPQPFEEAKAQGKPVLLGISAVWCHWCHVMDETSYSDDAVIRIINERFVPVRVDNDQRPDVNARYNMGGWPTTVFLTPDGEILHGATYVPPEMFRAMLSQIADFWQDPARRLDVGAKIAARAEHGPNEPGRAVATAPSDLDPGTARAILTAIERSFDEQYGGFGDEPKFPQTNVLNFLLDYFARSKDERARTMAQKTLHAMASGGMYDHVGGGFFRYSTTRDFSVPHFEKMLEDLAGLMLACARAGALFGDERLAKVAADVVRYANANLWNPAFGAYGGSQDADEEYYAKDSAARQSAAKPYVDPTLYASWNAEMARALIISGPLVDGGAAWIERGVAVLESLWSQLLVDGLMARYFDGQAHVRGLLSDQAWSSLAATSAFSATGERIWLKRASHLIDAADVLYDSHDGAYRDRIQGPADPARLAVRGGSAGGWTALLFAHQLPDPGDQIPIQAAGLWAAIERVVAGRPRGRPMLGVLAEYDALPGLGNAAVPHKEPRGDRVASGHGCGHRPRGRAPQQDRGGLAAAGRKRQGRLHRPDGQPGPQRDGRVARREDRHRRLLGRPGGLRSERALAREGHPGRGHGPRGDGGAGYRSGRPALPSHRQARPERPPRASAVRMEAGCAKRFRGRGRSADGTRITERNPRDRRY